MNKFIFRLILFHFYIFIYVYFFFHVNICISFIFISKYKKCIYLSKKVNINISKYFFRDVLKLNILVSINLNLYKMSTKLFQLMKYIPKKNVYLVLKHKRTTFVKIHNPL